jgi:hypothetical protein
LKSERQDVSKVASALSLMREQQQSRQQDRLRLLVLCSNKRNQGADRDGAAYGQATEAARN